MTNRAIAEKIHKWVHKRQEPLKPSMETALSKHCCKEIKTKRLPSGLCRNFPQIRQNTATHQASRIEFDWSLEAEHAHAIGQFDLPDFLVKCGIPEKIHRWNIRDYESIARKIRSLEKTKSSGRKYHFSILFEKTDSEAPTRSDEALWQEWASSKTDRQFQIGRITNYFS